VISGSISCPPFAAADADGDGAVGQEEYAAHVMPALNGQIAHAMDSEGAGAGIDAAALRGKLDGLFPEEVAYTKADGSAGTMPRAEMVDKMVEQARYSVDGATGSMTREDSGTSTLERMAEENPELARTVAYGKYAYRLLEEAGHVAEVATLAGLKSSPRDPAAGGSIVKQGEIWIVLVLSDGTAVETVMAYDRDLYAPPGLALLDAWKVDAASLDRLGDNWEARLDIPEPKMATEVEKWFSSYGRAIMQVCGVALFAAVVKIARVVGTQLWRRLSGAPDPAAPPPPPPTAKEAATAKAKAKQKAQKEAKKAKKS